jgi:hypothetical protein
VRFFVVFCLTCLILSVAFFADLISIPTAHAQDCQPAISTTSAPEPTPQPSTASVVINEVLTLPVHAQLYCTPTSSGTTPGGPWIELYNTQAQPFQLVHASLDSGPNTNPFLLVATSISAHGFIVVFPSSNTTFMSTFNSTLRLMLADTPTPLDEIKSLPVLQQDTSYARIPDGSSSWQITPDTTKTTTPTLGKSNNITLTTSTSQAQKKSTLKAKAQTLKKAPTQKATNNQASNQTQQSSSSSSQASTVNSTTPQLQPDWKAVRLPTRVATSISSDQTAPDLASITPITSSPDTLKKFALSLLTIALAAALWWCRKLFIKTRTQEKKQLRL